MRTKTINHAQQYTDNIRINTEDEAVNSILFINSGLDAVTVNTIPLPVGASLAFNCNENEVDISTYDIVFAGSAAQQIIVVKKSFVIK